MSSTLKDKLGQAGLFSLLSPYQKIIDAKLESYSWDLSNPLSQACHYALTTGGKRFRPALVLMIAKALAPGADLSHAALAVEFFHTASLIADDLPCMDNDDFRRGEPSLHKKFNENTALLASYALISEGYALLAAQSPTNLLPLTLQNAAFNTGVSGAAGGQYLDLYLTSCSLPALTEVIVKKTVSLFEIAFVFGWLYSGGISDKLPLVKKAAHHFGMAFQIADDLSDLAQDSLRQNPMNLALLLSPEKAKDMFHEETNSFTELLTSLDLAQSELAMVITLLRQPSL